MKVLHSNQNNGQQLLNCVGEHQKDRNRNKRITVISIPIILLYMFQDITTSDNYSSWQYYHHDDKRKLFTMRFNIMQCCLPSNIMYKSAIYNIEWGKGAGIVASFFNFPFVFQWTWKHIFCSGCLNLSCFFGCYIEFVFFSQIADLANEDTPQLYAACGRGPRSSMRVLRHGLEVMKTTFQIILFQKNLCVAWMKTCT